MKQAIQLRLGQSLTMTPQLQQAIRLLQLSTMELSMEVQQVLESNMMLEVDEDDGSAPEKTSESDQANTETETPSSSEQETPDREVGKEDIPEELAVDSEWEDTYDTTTSLSTPASGEFSGQDFENIRNAATETLADHLQWQVEMSILNETDKAIALAIVDAIDKDGYLNASLEEIHQTLVMDNTDLQVDADEIEAVLTHVQSMDPSGVGARDLRECLMLQLKEFDPETPWLEEATRLVSEHLDLLAAHDYTQLLKSMKLDKEKLLQVEMLIQTMNPRPGSHLAESDTEYVVPDVYVRKDKGAWQVSLNPEAVPSLRVNSLYSGMIKRADNSPDNASLKAHLQEARWFIKSLQSRSETLLKVSTNIVERQRAFLEYGEEAMKPLVLHDIAEALDMHESTISRVTTRKYMHTPRGIFELKYFFSSHVSTTMGGECSSTAIRAVIKKLIAEENTTKPLSDSKIANLLVEKGIKVARRTVAKYRESMTIPPSNERKRLT